MPARPATFNQIHVGDIEVTFVPDGFITSDAISSFPGSTEQLWQHYGQYLNEDGLVVMSLGALLVRTAGRVVLVDLGWGPRSMEMSGGGRISGGALVENLGRLGVRPEDVDVVLFSHLHADHTGWIVDPATVTGSGDTPGQATFPRAEFRLSQAEWDYWRSGDTTGPTPSREQLAVLGTRLSLLEDGDQPAPGIDVMATFGHTPGHLSYVISSGQDRVVVLGDAVHCPIEIDEPQLSFVVDVDPEMAQRTRQHIEKALLEPNTLTAGPHFSDLVFGRLLRGEGQRSWHFPESQILPVAG
jgi:glyoxylase-like metal-dependent hydrolase (beta-lactamase superfamily II)